ncbi:hypothetical protein CH063_15100 [Colletotrichum higginsianum]|uniref:Uncharacterized protein n=1 Tax=Colletotrichum higginsianum (strain IMI 349063) TaxID=759273 RepID=H1W1E2_COLHI|nr:hypothetical protein CH063_15100 [Colletotrichum higginsianum]
MSNSAIAKPLTLKCGLTLPNRLTKAAMAENWADNEGLPSKAIHAPYGEWADGGWGLVMTGKQLTTHKLTQIPDDLELSRDPPCNNNNNNNINNNRPHY